MIDTGDEPGIPSSRDEVGDSLQQFTTAGISVRADEQQVLRDPFQGCEQFVRLTKRIAGKSDGMVDDGNATAIQRNMQLVLHLPAREQASVGELIERGAASHVAPPRHLAHTDNPLSCALCGSEVDVAQLGERVPYRFVDRPQAYVATFDVG